jgi:hypothetical protein
MGWGTDKPCFNQEVIDDRLASVDVISQVNTRDLTPAWIYTQLG